MDNTQHDPKESDSISLATRPYQFSPLANVQPVALSSILKEMGLSGARIAAEELIDQTFIIQAAKPFHSAFKEGDHAWFCVCRGVDTDEVFTTVLGGMAVVDILDALVQAGFNQPLQVTLRRVKGGRYGRYYVLE